MRFCHACARFMQRRDTTVFARVEDVGHWVPWAWLLGRTQVREKEGLAMRQAYHTALQDWAEGCQHEEGHR